MDFLKIWHGDSKRKVRLHMLRIFSNFKNFGFYKGFPKILVFRNFGGQKLKILKFLDSHF